MAVQVEPRAAQWAFGNGDPVWGGETPRMPEAGGGVAEATAYRSLFEAIDAGFAIVQILLDGNGTPADYRFLEVNAAFEEKTGLVGATGHTARELLPDLESHWFERYGRVALTGEPVRFELHSDAMARWFSVYAFRVAEPADLRVAILFNDISARKEAETRLLDSERRFSALADGLPTPVWVLDENGDAKFVNRAYCEFFGRRRDELEGHGWHPVLHPDDSAAYLAAIDTAIRDQAEMRVSCRVRRHDGEWRWIESRAVPHYASDGGFVGLAGSSPDVTERLEIEQAREQLLAAERAARGNAESMARLKDEFLATLSHELRTPLTVILGWSDLLLQKAAPDDPLRRGLSAIAGSAKAQKTLISDMLDLSGMLMGKVHLETEPMDVGAAVRDAVHAQAGEAAEGGLAVHIHGADAGLAVLGDGTRMQQVLWNLLSNAIKFTPQGGVVDLSISESDGQVEISVRDSGDGIAASFLPHLFDRFRQADGTITRRHGGLGLGLAIVQQLVQMHGGSVRAESAGLGHGATFTVSLPKYDAAARGTRAARVAAVPMGVRPLAGIRLLVVEDQADMLDYLSRMLLDQGAEITSAGSAQQALDVLATRSDEFDVLLTDIGMPGMDGYELLRQVRSTLGLDAEALPSVAVTALAREDDRKRALDSGFQEHVTKPYSVAQLVNALRLVRGPTEPAAAH